MGANTYNTTLAIGEKAALIIAEELNIYGYPKAEWTKVSNIFPYWQWPINQRVRIFPKSDQWKWMCRAFRCTVSTKWKNTRRHLSHCGITMTDMLALWLLHDSFSQVLCSGSLQARLDSLFVAIYLKRLTIYIALRSCLSARNNIYLKRAQTLRMCKSKWKSDDNLLRIPFLNILVASAF